MPDSKHDEYDDNSYKKRCYCEKCKRTYDEWCKKNKDEGHTTCKRKCYTICEVVCEKPVTTVTHWGYKKEYEGKWEPYRGGEPPKHCKRCKKESKHCGCDDRKKNHKKDHKKRQEDSGFSDDY